MGMFLRKKSRAFGARLVTYFMTQKSFKNPQHRPIFFACGAFLHYFRYTVESKSRANHREVRDEHRFK